MRRVKCENHFRGYKCGVLGVKDQLDRGVFQVCCKGPQYLQAHAKKPFTPIDFGQINNLTGL